MFHFFLIFLHFFVKIGQAGTISEIPQNEILPPWITENPGYKNPQTINSVATGQGSISEKGPGSKGWIVSLNEKKGNGIEIIFKKFSLDSNSEDYLLVTPWPLTTLKQIKLFTGKFDNKALKVQVPNTKTFFLLYNSISNGTTQEIFLNFRRYGSSLEVIPPTTESPVKKNTVFEVQLKGKPLKDYSDKQFLQKTKEAMKNIAIRYCRTNDIPFKQEIPAEKMVHIHKISFCPFEWPERDICASVLHSIFVSGVILLEDQLIMDYELTSEHLRDMWSEENFPELEELGVTVFTLPGMASTILWWILITGLVVIGSLFGSFVFWKAGKHIEETGPRKKSVAFEEVKRRPKLKLSKLQRVPSFMYDSKKLKYPLEAHEEQSLSDPQVQGSRKLQFDNTLKSESPKETPIKNYYGGFLFGINEAFEDDGGNAACETQHKLASF